jgi:hypothetical protein
MTSLGPTAMVEKPANVATVDQRNAWYGQWHVRTITRKLEPIRTRGGRASDHAGQEGVDPDWPVVVPIFRDLLYGETRTRTGDTTIFSRVLYQLSYLAEAGRC